MRISLATFSSALATTAAAFACAAVLGGCAVEEVLPAPSCEQGASALIAAQSVPGASRVPCLDRLPDGWTVATVRIDEGGTTVQLDSDRAGTRAAELRYREACDVSDAVPAPTDLPPADRFDEIDQVTPRFRGARYYVFPGGCVWWRFDFDEGVTATETVAIGGVLQLWSRSDLNESIHETFIDEDV